MAKSRAKSFLYVTEMGVERRPFSALTVDDLQQMVGDRTGHCHLGLTHCYFVNPVVLIANDDEFTGKLWPIVAIINDQPFRGALVILAERTVDPHARPLWGDTFLDGLTTRELQEVVLAIKPPPGTSLRYRM